MEYSSWSEEYEPDAKNIAANVTYEEFKAMGNDTAYSAADIVNYLRFYGIYYPTYENDMELIRSTFNPCESSLCLVNPYVKFILTIVPIWQQTSTVT